MEKLATRHRYLCSVSLGYHTAEQERHSCRKMKGLLNCLSVGVSILWDLAGQRTASRSWFSFHFGVLGIELWWSILIALLVFLLITLLGLQG